MKPIVFIVDSENAVSTELEPLIHARGWQTMTARSAAEFLALPRILMPSCLLLELHLPDCSGLDLQRRLCHRTELPIVFMSRCPDLRATVEAMKAGAFELLTKPLSPDVVLGTLATAVELSRSALPHVTWTQALRERYESLSRREREVMRLLVTGRLNKQVGGELGISEITVKAHRGRMMRKMQAASFAELVTMATNLRRTADINA